MPAYYIGEHLVSDFALFDTYLAKVVPMIERFGGRYLIKAGSHEILEGIGSQIGWLSSNFPISHRSRIGTSRRNTSRSSRCAKAPRPT
jgi:uncharacterized protein (DUF1330 family)